MQRSASPTTPVPMWWFLLVVLALLIGLLALIGFLVFAIVSISRHGGGCRGPDDRGRNGGSSERDRDEGGQPHLGMGLFIARAIAEHHGGELHADNRTDGAGGITGAVMSVRLPLA